MSEIIVAENSGFCFGVQRAADSIENKIAHRGIDEKIYTLGKLIHNDTYISHLKSNGVDHITDADIDGLIHDAGENNKITVFIRAHGIPAYTEEKLKLGHDKNAYFNYVDCTCPFVKKIHKIAYENSGDDTCFVIMGSKIHPEVVGIVSYVKGEVHVFQSSEEVEKAIENHELDNLHKKRLVLTAQTTFDLSEWEKSQKIFKNLCTNRLFFDTICSVTSKRQNEASSLSEVCDVMITIGCKESSNTAKLYNICKKKCRNSFAAEGINDMWELLPKIKNLINTCSKVGIVAGASTPRDIIQEVYKTMSEKTEIKAESFEEMLESSLKTLNTGDTVTGIVTSVTDAELQLDLGAKVTGVITADQAVEDPSVKLTSVFKVGDEVEAFVIRVSDVDGFATLSKKRVVSDRNWKSIVAAKENGDILEGKVVAVNKGGVEINVNANRVFIPASQTGVPKDGDLNTLVGSVVRFRVIEVKDQGKKAIGSIRQVIRDERRERENKFWSALEVGQTYTGVVKSLTAYGAFVDIGGVDGMVHNTELSWKHIKSPAEVVSVGDTITVFVKSFDAEKKRISLGYKTEESEPWHIFTGKYAEGDVASVKIVSLTAFGAFAEIVDGVDGLIHISQVSTTRVNKLEDVLKVGDVVDAKIIAIDNEKKKVSLSMRALVEEMPAEEAPAEEAHAEEAPAEEAAAPVADAE